MKESCVWRPFTQHALEPQPLEIVRSEGAFLYEASGRKIFDAISSWWVTTHGHRQPEIMRAIADMSENLDQIIFAGLTHAPAEQLAAKLVRLAPSGLDYVFYSDSGSTSVEVALKMALGAFRHRSAQRCKFVVMEHSYHGDTIGAMSVGARGVFNAAYEPLLFDVARIPFPAAGAEERCFEALAGFLRRGDVAGVLVEPLILGAGGMLVYEPAVLKILGEMTKAAGAFFIADEVMTGWGRTGTLFACEQAKIAPDILCTSKGLTGGALPLAATLARREIFEAHYSADRARTFFHSSSYTANPIACAAALANIGVWEREPVLQRVQNLGVLQAERLARFIDDPRFKNIRRCGTIAALDWAQGDAGYMAEIGPKLRAFFLSHGVLARPLGNTIYLMPPYCAAPEDLDLFYTTLDQAATTL